MISDACFILLFIALLHVCYTDIRYRTIKNSTALLIAFLSLLERTASGSEVFLMPAAVILLAGFILSAVNIIGAGDVKLMAALSLSLGRDDTLYFTILTGLSGLPLVILLTALSYIGKKKGKGNNMKSVPYGVAITFGYLVTVLVSGRAA